MAIKLEPVERMEIVAELEIKTNYSFEYLNGLNSEQLLKLLKDKS